MPLSPEYGTGLGTNADGSVNPDYCEHCYKDGAFTSDISMEQMIDFCEPHFVANVPGMTPEKARAIMNQMFPQLKRWRTAR